MEPSTTHSDPRHSGHPHGSSAEGNGQPDAVAGHEQPSTEHSHVPVHFSRNTPARVLTFAIVAAVVLGVLFAWGVASRRHGNQVQRAQTDRDVAEPVPVDVVRVRFALSGTVLSLPGQASPFYETTIYARVSGYLHEWLVDIGDRVKKGQVLARIETPELDDQYFAAKFKVSELQANEHVAETSAEFAKASFGRYKASAPDGAVSQEEVDQKQAELNATTARVEAAKAQLDSGKAELKRLETLQKFKDVTAPFDGVITERRTDIGALVTAGSTTNTTPLFSISQSDQIRVFVDVPQPAVPDIKDGMTVSVEAREYPGTQFLGKVDRTSLSIDPSSKTLKVQVLVPNPKLTLLPGMYVTATFQTSRTNPPLSIPASALSFGPKGPEVAVVAADGRVNFHGVTIGRDMGDSVEIAAGLSENQVVALNVGSQVVEGEHVDPHSIDEPAKPTKSVAPVTTAARVER